MKYLPAGAAPGLERICSHGFSSLRDLRVLDLRGCPPDDFDHDSFAGLRRLEELYGSNNKLCCPAAFPDSLNTEVCLAPMDETASCGSLPRTDLYKIALAIIAALAIVGNVGGFIYRLSVNRTDNDHSCGMVVRVPVRVGPPGGSLSGHSRCGGHAIRRRVLL